MELNINRLINLIKRDIGIYWLNYLGAILIIIFLSAFTSNTGLGFYWFILALIFSFKEYNNPSKLKIQIITLPASNIEKYLYSFFIPFILLPLIILLSVPFGSVLRYLVEMAIMGKELTQALNLFPYTWAETAYQLLIILPFVSIVFFGNIYFNKKGGLKILFSFIAFFLFVVSIDAFILYLIKGEGSNGYITNQIQFPEYTKYIVSYGITAFFLFLSYLRLKEKEV